MAQEGWAVNSSAPLQGDIAIARTIGCGVILARGFVPDLRIEWQHPCIAVGIQMNLGEVDAIRLRKRGPINLLATYDGNFRRHFALRPRQRLIQRLDGNSAACAPVR